MSTLHRVFLGRQSPNGEVTEAQIRQFLDDLAVSIQGFTAIEAVGFWQGHRERSLVLEFSDTAPQQVLEAANRYKSRFEQAAVLVERLQVESSLV